MKALMISGIALILSLCAFTAVADHYSAPMIGGVEVFGCDFEDGKDMDDFMKVAINGTSLQARISQRITKLI